MLLPPIYRAQRRHRGRAGGRRSARASPGGDTLTPPKPALAGSSTTIESHVRRAIVRDAGERYREGRRLATPMAPSRWKAITTAWPEGSRAAHVIGAGVSLFWRVALPAGQLIFSKSLILMVGATGIEPVTPTMST